MTIFDISFSSNAGTLACIPCDATGHLHPTPDVILPETCPLHNKPWQYCVGCQKIWCPGQNPQHPAHQGVIQAVAAAEV